MAIWYAGDNEAHKTVAIKASWKDINADDNAWSEPVIIHKTPKRADGNAIVVFFNGKLHLYYNVILGLIFPWSNVIVKKKTSTDFGKTWDEPVTIIDKKTKGYTVRNHPLIVEEDGKKKLIIPTGQEKLLGPTTSQMLITEDGKNHHLNPQKIVLKDGRCLQPTMVQLANGNLFAFLRTNKNQIFQTISEDLGETWSTPEGIDFANPNSALDMVRTPKGEIILVSNITRNKGNTMKNRKSLHISYSPDEGKTWTKQKTIIEDEKDGRFAYPSVIYGSDNLLHITYTNRRKTIDYISCDVDWVLND